MPEATISHFAEYTGIDRKKVRRIQTEQKIEPLRKEGRKVIYDSVHLFQGAIADCTGDEGEFLDYTQERAKLAREQRRKASIEIEVLRRNLIPREEVEETIARAITSARARLLSIPTKAAPILVAMDEAEIEGALTEFIHEALHDLSTAGTELMGAPAKADGKPVGGRVPAAEPRGKRRTRAMEH